MKYKVGITPLQSVPIIWQDVAPYLHKATITTEPIRADISDLFIQCASGAQTLWIITAEDDEIVGAITTSELKYSRFKALSIQYLGGKNTFRWMPEAFRVISDYARGTGCATIEGYGSEKWVKALGRYGFKRVYTCFEAVLDQEAAAQAAE